MYIYDVGYHTYEESDHVQLYHKKEFNKKEFEDIVIKATIDVSKKQKVKKGETITFQSILIDVIEELTKNFDFEEVEFTSQFNVFGWADILDEKDWERDRDEQLNKITKSIKEDIEWGFHRKNRKK